METSDPAIAEDRARPFITRWKREFRQMLAQPIAALPTKDVPTVEELEEAAVVIGHDWPLEEMNDRRGGLRHASDAFWRANVRWYEQLRDERARDVATGNTQAVEDLADSALDALGWQEKVQKGSDLYERFCRLLTMADLAHLSVGTRQNAGDLEAESDSKLVRRVRERQERTASPAETLTALFERYAGQRMAEKRKRLDGVNQDRKKLELFLEFVGENRSAESITRREVLDFRFALEALPKKFKERRDYRGLTIREAAEKARSLNIPPLAKTTVNSYVSALSAFFDWLQELGFVPSNPCDGVAYRLLKGQNPRPTFSTDQLNAMLRSPLFTGFKADGEEHLPGQCRADDWRFWIPLACLFSGARLGEIAQLRIGDVRQERGVWFMHVRHDESTEQSTKSGFSRAAPIHSKLIELGFLAFRERQLERAHGEADQPMFPELQRNSRGQISDKVGRWWREYLEAIGIKDGGDGYGAHSFRHTMADLLRDEAELLDQHIAVALGHNQKTTTSGYGRLKQGTVTMLQSYFEAVRFEGVDFSPLTHASPAGRDSDLV